MIAGPPTGEPGKARAIPPGGQILRFVLGAAIPLPLQFVVGYIGLSVFGFHGPRGGQWTMAFWPLAYAVPLLLLSRRTSIGFRCGLAASCAVMFLLNLECAGVVHY